MKSDEVKGGIKVFKAEEKPEQEEESGNVGSRLRRSSIGSSKRKTWSPIQISRGKKELSISSSDAIKKSPIQSRKIRSDTNKGGETGQLRKSKSDPIRKNASQSSTDSIQLRKTKSELDRVPENEPRNEVDELDDGCEKIEAENVDNCKDFEVCQEKEISSNVGVVQNIPELLIQVDDDSDDVVDQVQEIESFDVKEISIHESKVVKEQENDKVVVNQQDKNVIVNEPKKFVNAHMRFHHKNEGRPVSIPFAVKQSPTIKRNSTIYQNFSRPNSSKKSSLSFFLFFCVCG